MNKAPWSQEHVDSLNKLQKDETFHGYTCPTAHPEGRLLVATKQGWICPHCEYKQDWSH